MPISGRGVQPRSTPSSVTRRSSCFGRPDNENCRECRAYIPGDVKSIAQGLETFSKDHGYACNAITERSTRGSPFASSRKGSESHCFHGNSWMSYAAFRPKYPVPPSYSSPTLRMEWPNSWRRTRGPFRMEDVITLFK